MAQAHRTLWLGRVRVRSGVSMVERAVRVWTNGSAPTADDPIEEIMDPFEAAQSHRGAISTADVRDFALAFHPIADGLVAKVKDVELAVPVRPSKILCVGRNYRAHAAEMGNEVPTEPMLFFKPPSALIASGERIVVPPGYARTDMESEIVVVIGRRGRHMSRTEAADAVAGYTLGNDVSCRDLQTQDKQWWRAKGFDTFAPLGPWIRVVAHGEAPPATAHITGRLDGELRQDAPLGDMVFDIPTVVAHVSQAMTLVPGDVIYTGTPEGVSPLSHGQVVEIGLTGWDLGHLRNQVAMMAAVSSHHH